MRFINLLSQQKSLKRAITVYPCLLYTSYVAVSFIKRAAFYHIAVHSRKSYCVTSEIAYLANKVFAVSYTHLDVYKRQAFCGADCFCVSYYIYLLLNIVPIPSSVSISISMESVSYTHLGHACSFADIRYCS